VKILTDTLPTPQSANTSAPQVVPAVPTLPAPTPPPAGGMRNSLRDIGRNLVISGVIPLIIYNLLKGRGASDFTALAVAAIPPALDGLFGVLRRRRIDLIAALVLAGIAVSMVAVVIGGNPRVLLIRESFLTGALGVACFASLLFFSRPLMFYFARYFETGDVPAKVAEFNAMWHHPYFRHVIRLITVVWGVAYTGEFLLRVVMASTLPIPIVVALSPVVFAAITVATILWTYAYARWARQRD
jgi:hypothetical protein